MSAFGTPVSASIFPERFPIVVAGAAHSQAILANSSLQTVNTNKLLNLSHATSYTNIIPVKIPVGATRCWIRGAIGTTFTTVTTLPIIKPVVTDSYEADGSGNPWRIDTDTSAGAGQTLTFLATPASNHFLYNSLYWTDWIGGSSGYDVRGGRCLYVMVSTAASLTDGASQVAASAYVLFGN